jgi:AcrR family transcriptional regulator
MAQDGVPPQAGRIAGEAGLPTRDVLINVSIPVFRNNGYDLTTVEDVARSAGLTTGAIYASFASKDELFFAAVSFVEDMFEGRIRAAVDDLPQPSSTRERLLTYLRTIPVILEAEPELMAFRSTSWIDLARLAFLLGLLKGAVASTRSSLKREDLAEVILMAAEGIASVKVDTLIPQTTSMPAVSAIIEHLLLAEPAES